MIVGLQTRIKLAIKQAAFGTIGVILALIGAGFLTAALFMLLLETRTPLFAATVIGCGYFGIALLFLLLGTRTPRAKVPPAPAVGSDAQIAMLVTTFLQGVMQGRAARRGSRRDDD